MPKFLQFTGYICGLTRNNVQYFFFEILLIFQWWVLSFILGVPWTEEEHRAFLAGIANLGKGNWREISTSFVISRTPAQVTSHAQKYFLRMNSLDKKKCRSSIFDVVISDLVSLICSAYELFLSKKHQVTIILPTVSISFPFPLHLFNCD